MRFLLLPSSSNTYTRYWMLASVASGKDVRVVTNDQMRDHAFQMMEPRWFVRWKQRHVIDFDFSHGHAVGRNLPRVSLQQLSPYVKKGDF